MHVYVGKYKTLDYKINVGITTPSLLINHNNKNCLYGSVINVQYSHVNEEQKCINNDFVCQK